MSVWSCVIVFGRVFIIINYVPSQIHNILISAKYFDESFLRLLKLICEVFIKYAFYYFAFIPQCYQAQHLIAELLIGLYKYHLIVCQIKICC